jgi:hypothetical protein
LPWIPFAGRADEEDNEVEEDAVATIVGLHVARSKPSDSESDRAYMQEKIDLSDSLRRLMRFWSP